jgi:hypothetical protein
VRVSNAPPLPDFAPMLRGQGPWDDPAYIREQILAAGAVRPESIIIDTFPYAGTTEDFGRLTQRSKIPPIRNVMSGWTEEEIDDFLPKYFAEYEKVLREEFGDGPYTMTYVAIISSAVKA